jgi:hypothetical protein
MRPWLVGIAIVALALSATAAVYAVEKVTEKTTDLSGDWQLDASKSDMPSRPGGEGGRGPRMGGGGGGGGWMGGGGMGGHHGHGGWTGRRGGSDGASAEGARPPRLPLWIHVTETVQMVSLEDSSGAVIREVATVPADADTFARAPGAEHILGWWDDGKLVYERTTPRGKSTESIALSDKGRSLVIQTKIQSEDESTPAREFKRVYRKVTHT